MLQDERCRKIQVRQMRAPGWRQQATDRRISAGRGLFQRGLGLYRNLREGVRLRVDRLG